MEGLLGESTEEHELKQEGASGKTLGSLRNILRFKALNALYSVHDG